MTRCRCFMCRFEAAARVLLVVVVWSMLMLAAGTIGAVIGAGIAALPAHGQWAGTGTSVKPRLLSSVAVSPVATNATVYVALAGGDVSPTQGVVAQPFDRAVLRRLRCAVSIAPGAGETVTLTVQTGTCGTALADSAVSCVISGAATTANDLTNTVTVSSGECAAYKAIYSAGAASSLPRAQLAAY